MNSEKKYVQKKISLEDYGKFIFVYRGSGTVSIIDGEGEKPHKCSFEAGQRINGNIIILCHDLPAGFSFFFRFGLQAKKFEGKTKNGHLIRSNKPEKSLLQLGYITKPENWLYDENLALKISELSITYSKEKCHKIHFGICNFEFDETDTFENGDEFFNITIPFTEDEKKEMSFVKLEDYDNIINRISILRTIDVTCELVLNLTNLGDLNKIITLVDDICFLLSIKNGTKISWIYYEIFDAQGNTIFRKHVSKVTRVYQPLDIFYFKEPRTFPTKKFLEDSYVHYMKYRDLFKLNRGVIDAYLESKAESDYIERRGGKIALAIEFLKNEYLRSKGENSEYIFPPQEFKKIIPCVSATIVESINREGVFEPNKLQSISSARKIEQLNRRSFGSILREIVKKFHGNVSPEEITLFIKCRDSLVHRGNFYCQTCGSAEILECEPLPSYMFEYFFMINILDRIFLGILGQDSKQIIVNWRNPSEQMKEWLK